MATYRQAARKNFRLTKPNHVKSPRLDGCPHKKGQCVRVTIIKPKKPNSAQRKLAKVKLSSNRFVLASIPGQSHTLQEFSVVLVRGGRVRDLPGVHYKLIRGALDFQSKESFYRSQSRSKYGLKRAKEEAVNEEE